MGGGARAAAQCRATQRSATAASAIASLVGRGIAPRKEYVRASSFPYVLWPWTGRFLLDPAIRVVRVERAHGRPSVRAPRHGALSSGKQLSTPSWQTLAAVHVREASRQRVGANNYTVGEWRSGRRRMLSFVPLPAVCWRSTAGGQHARRSFIDSEASKSVNTTGQEAQKQFALATVSSERERPRKPGGGMVASALRQSARNSLIDH